MKDKFIDDITKKYKYILNNEEGKKHMRMFRETRRYNYKSSDKFFIKTDRECTIFISRYNHGAMTVFVLKEIIDGQHVNIYQKYIGKPTKIGVLKTGISVLKNIK